MKKYEVKSILKISLPLMAAFLAQKGMQFIDTLMMGWIGPDALAAGALGTSIFITILLFCTGTLSAVGIFIARAKGANNFEDIKPSLQHGMYLALILAIPCMILIWFTPHLLSMIGEDPNVVAKVALLLHGLVWGFPGFLLFLLFREFIAAFSLTRFIMTVALCSLPLTIAGNYVLIYGKYGFPQLGIAGIGYAGALVMWFMFLCLFIYSKRHSLLKNHVGIKLSRFDGRKLNDMLYIGLPSGVLFLLEAGMFLSAAIIMGFFGVNALAAHQIAMQCVSIAYTFPFALGMATALQVGHAAGANDYALTKRLAFTSLTISIMLAIILAIIFIFTPDLLVRIFLNENDANYKMINQLSIQFLTMAGIFQCFDAIQAIIIGVLRGLKDTISPMIFSIGSYWIIGVASAYYFSFYTRVGAVGVWYGLTLGICSIAMILMLRLVTKLKKI